MFTACWRTAPGPHQLRVGGGISRHEMQRLKKSCRLAPHNLSGLDYVFVTLRLKSTQYLLLKNSNRVVKQEQQVIARIFESTSAEQIRVSPIRNIFSPDTTIAWAKRTIYNNCACRPRQSRVDPNPFPLRLHSRIGRRNTHSGFGHDSKDRTRIKSCSPRHTKRGGTIEPRCAIKAII